MKKLKTKAWPDGRNWPDEICLDVGSNMPMDVYSMHHLSDLGVLYIRHDLARAPLPEPAKSSGGDTPRTDNAIRGLCEAHDGDLASDFNMLGHFARTLERELNEANIRLETVNKIATDLRIDLAELKVICSNMAARLPDYETEALAAWKAFQERNK